MNEKILIVDDEPHITKMLASRLKANGYRIITAENGKEGLQKVKDEQPELVLLDIMMPEMDGHEVLYALKKEEETKSIPVIMVTAKGQIEDVEKSSGMGATDYVVKPFNPVVLLDKVRRALAGSK